MTDAKEAARRRLGDHAEGLIALSHRIHASPEIGFEEEKAAAWIGDALVDGGFDVVGGVAGLPTALSARAGSGPLTIAVCAEYDALPGIGHACGHNVIAAAAVGAALALRPFLDDLGLTLRVLGTPAEEGGGGKIAMLQAGAFDGTHAAMMVHPAPVESDRMQCRAVSHFDVHYSGVSAHASAFPELGVNAADALTVAQVAIGLLRQHILPTQQVHGIVTKGGDAANIVPASTRARYYARASTLEELALLEPRVHRCFEAGAIATGAALRIEPLGPAYSELHSDCDLASLYRANAEALGRVFPSAEEAAPMSGSTDMGNVSLVLPSIHPMLGIEAKGAVNHQPEFAAACITSSADQAALDGALGMAWTAVDVACTPSVRERLLAGAH